MAGTDHVAEGFALPTTCHKTWPAVPKLPQAVGQSVSIARPSRCSKKSAFELPPFEFIQNSPLLVGQ